MTLSLYVPVASPVHRTPAGLKLGLLAALAVALFLVDGLAVVGGTLAAVLLLGLGAARLPWRSVLAQVRPVWPWLVLLFAFHLVVTDWHTGTVVVLRLLALVAAAAVVTATTRVTELVAVVEWLARPLTVFGVRPARIGLVIAMTLRFVPLVAERAQRIRDAQAARGAERFRFRSLVPLLVQVLRLADTLGEALDARGADAPVPVRRGRAGASTS
ncbi:energy-coupling factor transporter transmembrane component T [Blastococcus sp. TF02A-26]|uniref:energy-coupling factor transporter transmembrane component T n=1 Tax=Blastococcus sp. TF02A-26 TaxID=2250577 RepID=UPI000DEB723B|nr:energy-coupling factor transporter transmembrane component T [Blastococcus sp. TF02A-26]RBY81799.1 energy-coupling factor transporter transmembrane protein EcfT [Blastococcus sp. TF02A-26]